MLLDIWRMSFPAADKLSEGCDSACAVQLSDKCAARARWHVVHSGDDFCGPCYIELLRRHSVGMKRLLDDIFRDRAFSVAARSGI